MTVTKPQEAPVHPPVHHRHVPGVVRCAMALTLIFTASCAGSDDRGGAEEEAASSGVTVFESARLIIGDGSPPVEDGLLVIQDGRITYAGTSAAAQIPDDAVHVDLSGKTVIPTIVNAHVHLSSDRAERVDQLRHMAYYGAGAVLSLGLDEGGVGFELRGEAIPDGARSQSAGRGITSPEPGRSQVPYWVTTEDEARDAVRELASQNADFVKIWVDDRGGQYERLSPALYQAVIDEAHQHGLRVTAHVFTLEDAKGLLRAGIDAFAHGVRDMDVDDELVQLWRERPDVVLVPNLPGPGVAEDLGWLAGTVPTAELERMQEAASVERPEAQASFGIQARNLARLSGAGVRIAFGTDGSSPWAIHQEMEDMVRTGMTPADVIRAATSTSADLLRMPDVGSLSPGKSADFVVLDANPLADIANTRAISAVYLRGVPVDRESLGAHFRGQG